MKKVLYAWIEQVLQFDSCHDLDYFIENTAGIKVISITEEDDKYILHCKKPYNNNKMK